METKTIDADEFRAAQRQQWNVAAGGWRKWTTLMDSVSGGISDRLVELAGVDEGSRVLDVAAGYGEPTLSAARRAGPSGRVVASDISSQMLAFGHERAAAAGLHNIEFVESDAMSLDFEPGSFDAALSRFGIIFEPDGEGAAARVRGFLRPGSRMAIASWGPPERVPFVALPMRTTMQRLDLQPPPPGTPGPLSRPTPEALGGLLGGGGFSDIGVEEAEVTFDWDSADDFTTFIRDVAPPISALMASHPPDVQEATWAAITEAAREHAGDDGRVAFTNLVLMAVGSA